MSPPSARGARACAPSLSRRCPRARCCLRQRSAWGLRWARQMRLRSALLRSARLAAALGGFGVPHGSSVSVKVSLFVFVCFLFLLLLAVPPPLAASAAAPWGGAAWLRFAQTRRLRSRSSLSFFCPPKFALSLAANRWIIVAMCPLSRSALLRSLPPTAVAPQTLTEAA